ncbi:MAG: hypothetical protein E7289_04240 [Lachnospiraceae bacterium]|nr:hypothetical protein [Lachnospiraceae bacterium]
MENKEKLESIEIENNGFENFESQGRYESIREYFREKANRYARVSQVLLICAAIMIWGGSLISGTEMGIDISDEVIIILAIGLYLLSLSFAVIGYRIKKTSLTKLMLISDITIPFFLFCGGIFVLYIFWLLFGGFTPERTTFMEFLMSFL